MKRLLLSLPLLVLSGCVVTARPAYVVRPAVVVAPAPVVVAPAPVVVEQPASVVVEPAPVVVEGGFAVEVLPPVTERVYLYEPGYPPGCYLWGGFYYWGGHRYSRDVFINRVVNVNIRSNRYVNVTENRRYVDRIKVTHHEEFKRSGGHVQPQHRPEHH